MCVVAIYDTIDSRYIAIIYKLSIYRVMYDTIVHNKYITLIKHRSYVHPRTTPHTSPLRASYGVSLVRYK